MKKNKKFSKNFLNIVQNILKDEEFLELKNFKHHVFFNRYEHLINVSKLSYKLAKILKADIETCVLAGLLHDFHFTYIKSHIHWIESAENAQKFNISQEVSEIIKNHMYPFWRKSQKRPTWKEFWIVKFADSFSALYEIWYSILTLSFKWVWKIKMRKNKSLLTLI